MEDVIELLTFAQILRLKKFKLDVINYHIKRESKGIVIRDNMLIFGRNEIYYNFPNYNFIENTYYDGTKK